MLKSALLLLDCLFLEFDDLLLATIRFLSNSDATNSFDFNSSLSSNIWSSNYYRTVPTFSEHLILEALNLFCSFDLPQPLLQMRIPLQA